MDVKMKFSGGQPPESAPPRTAEENLWWAVLYTLVRDIEHRAKDMHREIDKTGTVSVYNHEEWRSLLHVVDSPWMGEVCDYVGWHHRRLKEVTQGLTEKYDLETYEVRPKDWTYVFVTREALRMRKRGT